MDLYNFITSRDIREHLRSINYQFSLPEIAYIIDNNRELPLEEKFAVWRHLIAAFPDCSMEKRQHMEAIPSFHRFLEQYMAMLQRWLDCFYRSESGAIWTGYCCYEKCPEYGDYGCPYSSFDACMGSMQEDIADGGAKRIYLKKQWLDTAKEMRVIMDTHCHVLSVEMVPCPPEDSDTDMVFEGMWFDIPTPFHRGDILTFRDHCLPQRWVVLDYMLNWDSQTLLAEGFSASSIEVTNADRHRSRFAKDGDPTDMAFLAYELLENGELDRDHYMDYFSVERVSREALSGDERFLTVVSDYLLGKSDEVNLMDAHEGMLARRFLRSRASMYDKAQAIQLGLLQEDV